MNFINCYNNTTSIVFFLSIKRCVYIFCFTFCINVSLAFFLYILWSHKAKAEKWSRQNHSSKLQIIIISYKITVSESVLWNTLNYFNFNFTFMFIYYRKINYFWFTSTTSLSRHPLFGMFILKIIITPLLIIIIEI